VHSDPGDLCLDDAPVEAAVEVARLDRCAVAGGEHQAGIGPGIDGLVVVGVLLLLAEQKLSALKYLAPHDGITSKNEASTSG
jgi:hypothetical protein